MCDKRLKTLDKIENRGWWLLKWGNSTVYWLRHWTGYHATWGCISISATETLLFLGPSVQLVVPSWRVHKCPCVSRCGQRHLLAFWPVRLESILVHMTTLAWCSVHLQSWDTLTAFLDFPTSLTMHFPADMPLTKKITGQGHTRNSKSCSIKCYINW